VKGSQKGESTQSQLQLIWPISLSAIKINPRNPISGTCTKPVFESDIKFSFDAFILAENSRASRTILALKSLSFLQAKNSIKTKA
jgi:hypothetical protein